MTVLAVGPIAPATASTISSTLSVRESFPTGSVASLTISPAKATVIVGSAKTYTAKGYTSSGRSLGYVTSKTTFRITNGTCTRASCTSTKAGPQTVTGTDGAATATATLAIKHGPLASLTVSPAKATVTAGSAKTYTVKGYDAWGNTLGDVASSTTFTITNGTCTRASCTSTTAGTQTVTATDGSATATATLTIDPGPVATLTVSPSTATVTAGDAQTYTATGSDQWGNTLGDVTSSTTFTITNGTCTGASCTSTTAGSQTVTATDGSATATATLTVDPGPVATLTVSPSTATVTAGDAQTYTATGSDQWGNTLGDVTSSTTFTITNGTCTGASCTSTTAGSQTVTATDGSATATATLTVDPSPIQHVVVIYQENHSFDNVLGAFCEQTTPPRCDGATSGVTSDGATVPLGEASDVVPSVDHGVPAQTTAINNGAMNGFDKIWGCSAAESLACYTQYEPSQIPNVAALASQFAVSDRTFELNPIESWGAHLELVTTDLDGFEGQNPPVSTPPTGWGCDSGKDAPWSASGVSPFIMVPSCVPAPAGTAAAALEPAPVKTSPVKWVPTIMDSLDTAGKSWKIYAAGSGTSDYAWSVCPTFADCLYSKQAYGMVPTTNVVGRILAAQAAAESYGNFPVGSPCFRGRQRSLFAPRTGRYPDFYRGGFLCDPRNCHVVGAPRSASPGSRSPKARLLWAYSRSLAVGGAFARQRCARHVATKSG